MKGTRVLHQEQCCVSWLGPAKMQGLADSDRGETKWDAGQGGLCTSDQIVVCPYNRLQVAV